MSDVGENIVEIGVSNPIADSEEEANIKVGGVAEERGKTNS